MVRRRDSRKALTDYGVLKAHGPLCSLYKSNGEPCTTSPSWRLTRSDGTSYEACTRHYNRLMVMRNRRPEVYQPLKVARVK